jgi:ubiquinone/menaquinone biosynthesis C-methylase UbiE
MTDYVHGYNEKEARRLEDQAGILTQCLLADTCYPPGCRVLEAGCGTGSQTVTLAKNNPSTHFLSIDISPESIEKARAAIERNDLRNVTLQVGDIMNLPYEKENFDHIFICFVLEHLPDPTGSIVYLSRFLKKGGSITVIEGDHGSFYCYPESKAAMKTVQCLIDIQKDMKGDSMIGRRLYPLITAAGYTNVMVMPRVVYVDSSKPNLVDGFSKKTFIAMVEGVKEKAISLNYIDEATWQQGIKDLYRATQNDGTFNYTFFKAIGFKK